MKSNITIYSGRLVTKLKNIPGAKAEKGYLAQHLSSGNTSYPFFALQPVDEQKNSNTNKTVSAERKYNLFVAVAAGPDQDEDLDDALFDMRVALLKDNRLLSLGDNPISGKFTIGEPEFFIPEGFEDSFVAQIPVTINYTDEL